MTRTRKQRVVVWGSCMMVVGKHRGLVAAVAAVEQLNAGEEAAGHYIEVEVLQTIGVIGLPGQEVLVEEPLEEYADKVGVDRSLGQRVRVVELGSSHSFHRQRCCLLT